MVCRRFFVLILALVTVAATVAQSAQARAAEPQKLFALDAEQGTLTPLKGKPEVYRLVIEQVRARAIYFTDRPAREVGTIAVRPMLRRLFAGDSPAPNAAVNAFAADRGQLLMGIELAAWHYDAPDQKLTFRVRRLDQQGGETIENVREDVVLPRSFRDVSLFIDDCCDAAAPATAFNPGQLEFGLSINNGPQVQVGGASRETWLPGSAPIGFNSGGPQQGVLGPGTNYLTIIPAGAITPVSIQVNLPGSVPYNSVQLYLFVGPLSVGWAVLDEGRVVASAVVPTSPG